MSGKRDNKKKPSAEETDEDETSQIADFADFDEMFGKKKPQRLTKEEIEDMKTNVTTDDFEKEFARDRLDKLNAKIKNLEKYSGSLTGSEKRRALAQLQQKKDKFGIELKYFKEREEEELEELEDEELEEEDEGGERRGEGLRGVRFREIEEIEVEITKLEKDKREVENNFIYNSATECEKDDFTL